MDINDLRVNILVCHHKEGEYVKSECLVPIQVGRAISNTMLEYCIGDDTGDNISYKNKNWCELTAMYWQWKNVDADYYGLFHYRRYLSFKYNSGTYFEENLGQEVINLHKLNDYYIKQACSKNDIITGELVEIHRGNPDEVMSAYDFYVAQHYKEDIDNIIDIVKKDYNFFYQYLTNSLEEHQGYFGNIQIMRKEYFNEYCTILFGILREFEKIVDMSKYNNYQSRVFGFLAERISNAYILYAQNEKHIKLSRRGLLHLVPFSREKFSDFSHNNEFVHACSDINICFTFDDNYINHALVAMKSLVENYNSNKKLNVYIVHDDKLNSINMNLINKEVGEYINLEFIKVNSRIFDNLPLNRSHININTYYRLALDLLLPDIKKIIYLDSDIVVLGNIAKLWNISLDNNCVGAVLDEGGINQSRRLNLLQDSNYFNAGVMIFDLEKIRESISNPLAFYFECYENNKEKIMLQDQDILNIAFQDSVKILPLAWNLNARVFTQNIFERKYSLEDEISAIKDVGILHFTDRRKPWKFFSNHPMANKYWEYRNKLNQKNYTLFEKLSEANYKYLKINYKGYGDYVILKLNNINIKIKKDLVLKFINKAK